MVNHHVTPLSIISGHGELEKNIIYIIVIISCRFSFLQIFIFNQTSAQVFQFTFIGLFNAEFVLQFLCNFWFKLNKISLRLLLKNDEGLS